MADVCTEHPDVAASYVCDGCAQHLCGDCIEESHALLLCRLCGERALPLDADQPATVRDLRKEQALTRPYSLSDALFYPFRGTGRSLFLATLFCMLVIWILRALIITGIIAGFFNVILWLMIVGLQFRIVRSTSDGDNELPDWPDFMDFTSLLQDVATWLVIYGVVIVGLAFYSSTGLLGSLGSLEPHLGFWIGFTVCQWLGTALAVMGYGAAGTFSRIRVLFVHRHVQGYLAAGADAINITNLVFGLGAAVLLAQAVLDGIPFVGWALSAAVGVYWIFILPHLAGLLFRRHTKTMEELYWSDVVAT